MEIELKLLIDKAHVERLLSLPLLEKYAIKKPRQQKITNTYFDTPTLDIRQSSASLRIRHVNGEWVQTLKSGGSVDGGLHQRNEWESKVDSPFPDLPALRELVEPHSSWEKLLRTPSLAESLHPIFTSHIKRTAWDLKLPDGDEIELVLDQGSLECDGAEIPIGEIELELKSGTPDHLFDYALEMIETVPLHIGNLSKAERGYMLYAPEQRNPVKAARLALSNDLTVEEVFKAIVANCMAQIQHNEAGVAEGDDPESIHQMRVGVRRLRSALGLFKDVIACPDTLKEELRWLATKLGEARDWEVFAGATLSKVHVAVPKRADMQPLQQAARDIARKNREEAAAAINSMRHTRLMLSFSSWMQETRWRDSINGSAGSNLNLPIRKFAKRTLAHTRNRLRKREKQLHGNDAQARHQVRIAAKKARYAAEFFQSLYPARQVQNYVDALSALQDDLGWLNDAVVADGLLHRLQEEQPDFAGSAGFARGYLTARIESDIPQLEKRWKQFMKAKLFYQ